MGFAADGGAGMPGGSSRSLPISCRGMNVEALAQGPRKPGAVFGMVREADADDTHMSAATGARQKGIGCHWRLRLLGTGGRHGRRSEEFTDAPETDLSVRSGEEAVVPDAVKAARQDVEKETPDEFLGFERQGAMASEAFVAVILDAEGDARAVEVFDALGRTRWV